MLQGHRAFLGSMSCCYEEGLPAGGSSPGHTLCVCRAGLGTLALAVCRREPVRKVLPADSVLCEGYSGGCGREEGGPEGCPGVRATWESRGGGGPQKRVQGVPNKSRSREGTGRWRVTAAS